MNVQWYPGHMTKAKRMMQSDIKLIDLVIELLDARAPLSSQNPDIDELAKGKARLVLLNKSDLADPGANDAWLGYFKEKNMPALLLDSRNRGGFEPIRGMIAEIFREKTERDRKRGIINRPVRAMIVGIPNVGKSTFINSLSRRASTKTGNKPGVTKGKQWIKLDRSIELLDTPGILWPKFENRDTGINLAIIGSVSDEIVDGAELALKLIEKLKAAYPQTISMRFEIDEDDDALHILDGIALKRGCLKKGGAPDYDKAAKCLIDEYRSGRLGRISLERP
ncbi:MAG: ribosome biogenesis GTPase YlqF [Lachnospiraceae bacterium]|nr:ribosome biogenesis GTPase YlqF [Lachnospiraceae bacterium]